MVEHDAAADTAGRIDVDAEAFVAACLDVHRQQALAATVQLMPDAVRLQCQKAFGEQEDLQCTVECGVAADDRLQVAAGRLGQHRQLVVQPGEAIGQGVALFDAVGQGVADAVGERATEVRLIEDGLADDRGQGRLGVQGTLRLCAQLVPQVADGKVRHGSSLRVDDGLAIA